MDRELTPMERTFFWMPLGHSEDPTHQERIVHHREEQAANAPPHLRAMTEFGISQAKGARDVIARFGATDTATRYWVEPPRQKSSST